MCMIMREFVWEWVNERKEKRARKMKKNVDSNELYQDFFTKL